MYVPGVALVGLDKDEYVVHSHGQHKEGNDLEDDEGGRHPSKAKRSCEQNRNIIIKLSVLGNHTRGDDSLFFQLDLQVAKKKPLKQCSRS